MCLYLPMHGWLYSYSYIPFHETVETVAILVTDAIAIVQVTNHFYRYIY